LATDHLIIPEMMAALREAGLDSVEVFVGGIIPEQERPMLLKAGVRAIFGPGSQRDDIVECAKGLAAESRDKKQQAFGG
jgi:methylmalonyl-CoA mutase C-terminal domain/subunit